MRKFLLVLTLLFCGCGGSDVPVAQNPVSTSTVLVRQTLQRAVAPEVTEFHFFGLDESGRVVFGPTILPKASEVRVEVPLATRTFVIHYMNGTKQVAVYHQAISPVAGQEVLIEDPESVAGPSIDPPSFFIVPGATAQLQLLNQDGVPVPAHWEFVNSIGNIGRIDQNGVVTADNPGLGYVFGFALNDDSISAEGFVTVVAPDKVGQLSILPSPIEVPVQYNQLLQVQMDGVPIYGGTWQTLQPFIAQVDPNSGNLLGVSPGETTVTVTVGSASVTETVNVTLTDLVSVDVEPSSVTLAPRQPILLKAIGTFDNSHQLDLTIYADWVSSNPNVATVVTGGVEPLIPGTSTISATVGGLTGTCQLTVTQP